MKEKFVAFITDPGPASFLAIRESVIHDKAYDPYSDDLEVLDRLFIKEAYEEIAEHRSINILLSPMAHLIKSVAYEKLGMTDEAESEMHLWQTLLKALAQSGDGTAVSPYLVTRISDEKDVIEYLGETFAAQTLIHQGNRKLDCITLTNGRDIHFDITTCYGKEPVKASSVEEQVPVQTGESTAPKEEARLPEPPPATHPLVVGDTAEDFLPEEEEEDEEMVEKKKWWKFW